MRTPLITTLVVTLTTSIALADWPMHRGDAARSGYTAEELPADLKPAWTFRPAHPPRPAWPREQRAPFDRAFHVVAARGLVFFGSSADGTITALDAATGSPSWTFHTEGPVRFPPALWNDRLFAVSDDGHLYSLSADDGRLLRKWRGGPDDEKVLGNERIVSRWPARGGPVIFDDTVYYAAGVWQSEGVYLYAIDAAGGDIRWVNDSSGGIYMPQPHGGANAESGVTAQGNLLATNDYIFVPTGRAVPAAFSRADGKFLYYHLQENRGVGGTEAMLNAAELFTLGADYTGALFDAATGETLGPLRPGAFASLPGSSSTSSPGSGLGTTSSPSSGLGTRDTVLYADGKALHLLRRTEVEGKDRRGNPVQKIAYQTPPAATAGAGKSPPVATGGNKQPLTSIPDIPGGVSLIVANRTAISGVKGQLTAVDLDPRSQAPASERVLWSHKIVGIPYGLAAADGRLFVSTDDGSIHCYAAAPQQHREIRSPANDSSRPASRDVTGAVDEILKRSGVTEGYCVDLASGDSSLAMELARRTKFHIIAVEADAENVAVARKRLAAAGLYGTRVVVLNADPAKSKLPKFIANLVVSGRSVTSNNPESPPVATGGTNNPLRTEAQRLQRPYGGVVCLGPAGSMHVDVRGALPNAGTWTHQYSDAANTGCTLDDVKGPLRALWYRDVDLDLPQRHGRGPAPLFDNGRLFHLGMDALLAVDAYNGRVLWRFEVPGALKAYNADHLMGTAGTGSSFCIHNDSVYIRQGATCHRLDAATGNTLATFTAPKHANGNVATWGYIACADGILLGSAVDEEHVVKHSWRPADMSELFTESKFLFAFDVETGKLLWRYDAAHSIRHNAVALGDGRVFLIDRPLAVGDLLSRAERRGDTDKAIADKEKPEPQPTGKLVVLDAKTGMTQWTSDDDIFGTVLSYSRPFDMLLMGYQPTRFKLPSEVGGRLAVFRATDGYRLWEKKVDYVTRPLINDRTIYAQGGAWDLLTGEDQPFDFKRSYGCGQLAGSKHLLLFRSATFGYFDFSGEQRTKSFGGVRPGCWINAIPVGGLVLLPDASAGCTCSYQTRAWLALQGSD